MEVFIARFLFFLELWIMALPWLLGLCSVLFAVWLILYIIT